jgi:hypothetical protein
LLNETKSIFIYFFVGVIVVAFMMDQQELSLLVANFILLIQALQRVICDATVKFPIVVFHV